ncbi:acyltransferase family protein [Bradyrhizobium sp. 956_D2_N1_5]|uniref:acyltransferase family protein n=1 Tax=unclassified Bradyrhizobium TaxID=2631580 RepID=UPI003F231BA0
MEFIGIQYLRGAAALMIVVFHCGAQISRGGAPLPNHQWLTMGVDVFFVISGFIMWVSTAPPSDVSPWRFWWRRVRRIVPLYWLVTSIAVAALVLTPSLVKSGKFDLWHAVSSFLFVPSSHPITGKMEPVVIPGWSLNYEMFFYFIFGACLFLGRRFRLLVLLIALVVLIAAGFVLKSENKTIAFYTSPYLAEFAIGVLLGFYVTRGGRAPRAACIALLLLGASLSPATESGLIGALIASTAVVAGIVLLDVSQPIEFYWLPCLLGDASYSIYITHSLVISAFGQLYQRVGLFELTHGVQLYLAGAVLTATVVGVIVHQMIELPILGNAFFRRAEPSSA